MTFDEQEVERVIREVKAEKLKQRKRLYMQAKRQRKAEGEAECPKSTGQN
jgi:hypothetical protein